jgi:PAS domain S-box-containing protein
LGETDGITILRRALAEGCRHPIILLTGQDDRDLARKALREGAADYLEKGSITPESLARSIHYSLERRRAQEREKHAENLYRTLAANLPNGAVMMIDRNLRFLLADGVGLAWLGYSKADLEGKQIWEVLTPDEMAQLEPVCRRTLEGEEIKGEHGFGSRTFSYHTAPLRGADGGIQGAMLLVQDITDRKRFEDQIQQFNALLEQRVEDRTRDLVEANREMEAFCYSISHDLRAPLRAIMSTSMILQREHAEPLDDEATSLLERQASAAKRLGNLIDDLLELSRLSRSEIVRSPCDFSALAREVLEEVSSRDWPSCAVEGQIADGIAVDGDSRLLRLLLQNLFDNSCKFSKGDSIRIEIGEEEREGRRVVFVRDDGIGFDQDYVHKIFLPFERLVLEHEYPGTGIGLANVKRIVEKHGGEVWAEGEPGRGATFYFVL